MGGIIPSPNHITGDVTITDGSVIINTVNKNVSMNIGGSLYQSISSATNDLAVGSIIQPGNMLFYGGNGKACQFYTNFAITAEFKGGNGAAAGLYLRGETQGIYSHQQAAKAWAAVDAAILSYVGYGISSIADLGPGSTEVFFTAPFADTWYAAVSQANVSSTVIKNTGSVIVSTGSTDYPFSVVVYR